MHIRLTHRKAFRRAGAVLAAILMTAALIPVTSASAAVPAAPAAPRASTCDWFLVPSRFWITDPKARVLQIWNRNNDRPGSRHVAYKLTGRFPHSTNLVLASYNNLLDLNSPAYTQQDYNFVPDPGSVNPFVPGTRFMAPKRNYTAWLWPDSDPVPAGLKNVVLYPTKPEDPGGVARWNAVLRLYYMQPGYSAIAEAPTITAVSARNPNRPVACPLVRPGTISNQVVGFYAHRAKYGPLLPPPEPPNSNKIYFTRYPGALGIGLDGYPGPLPAGCANYLVATVPITGKKVSVVTMHKVPTYFNINDTNKNTVMEDYQIRYQSILDTYFTANGPLYRSLGTNTNDSVYTAKGEWVTVWLPSEPKLPAAQERAIRVKAAQLRFNVVQLPPRATGPIQRNIPDGPLFIRQKGISPNFPYSNQGVPCWTDPNDYHDYKTYTDQTSPAFFAKYASNPKNNGPFYVDGVKQTVPEFLAR